MSVNKRGNMKFYLSVIVCGLVLKFGHVTCTDCPDGWLAFQGSCYLFNHNHQATFVEAEEYCRQHQESHLVQLETMAENEFIKNYLKLFISEPQWIGMTDEQTEGVWKWYTSDAIVTYKDWAPHQGFNHNYIDGEDCAVFNRLSNYQWEDLTCDHKAEPICEISAGDGVVIG